VGYRLETTTKDLQVDECEIDFSSFDANRLIQCTKSIGILGEKFPL
jgi:hypothetical protein